MRQRRQRRGKKTVWPQRVRQTDGVLQRKATYLYTTKDNNKYLKQSYGTLVEIYEKRSERHARITPGIPTPSTVQNHYTQKWQSQSNLNCEVDVESRHMKPTSHRRIRASIIAE